MRIAICGAHWVGKSTISKLISQEYWLPILHDIVVDAYKLWFTINEETPIETQIWLTWKQVEQEKNHPVFVADKCIFDYHIYAKALNMDNDVIEITRKIALKTHQYDHIFYIKPEFPIVDDWLRSTNIEFQNNIQDTYENFMKEHNIKYNCITGSVEERFDQIKKHINK